MYWTPILEFILIYPKLYICKCKQQEKFHINEKTPAVQSDTDL